MPIRDEMGPFSPADITPETAQKRIVFGPDSYADVGQPIPGSGLPAEQVQLRPTNAKMLAADPTLGQREAEIMKARYGGEASTEIRSAAEGAENKKPQAPIYDRQRFEQMLFQDMGGNPYEIDPMKEVDKITAEQMPQLFNQIFHGRAIWADRNRLSKKQQDFWQNELRQFRAHVKDHVDSDRATKISMYQFMMGQFDNQAKEEAAKQKRLGQYQESMLKEKREARLQQRTEQEHMTRMMADRRSIIKRQSEIMSEGIDPATGQMRDEAQAEFMELANQLQSINRMMNPEETPVSTEKPIKAATEKPIKSQTEKPVETRRTKDGRLLGKMADGRIVVLSE